MACKGLCYPQCIDELIDLSPVETQRIERDTGVHVTSKQRGTPCAALDRGRCSVHSVRPMICRLYGAADGLRCEHGCLPSRWLRDRDVVHYLAEAMKVGRHPMFGDQESGFINAVSTDPEVAPLLAKYLRGNRTADLLQQLRDTIEVRRVAAGYPPRR